MYEVSVNPRVGRVEHIESAKSKEIYLYGFGVMDDMIECLRFFNEQVKDMEEIE